MLNYFVEQNEIEQVKFICITLNDAKKQFQNGDYSAVTESFEKCKQYFCEIKEFAIKKGDELLANSQFVFKEYFLLFCELAKYFELLYSREYKLSWNKLQDCFDIIKYIGRFTDPDSRFELPELYDLLIEYERLYPYKLFCSSEYIIEEATCSICGKSVLGLDCPHIKGNLYWGEPAIHNILKIKEFQAVAIVEHPADKRCIIEVSDETINEIEKYQKLSSFVDLNLPPLQMFSIDCKIETRMDNNYRGIPRNELCPCGSRKKFKKCCYSKLYYPHYRFIVTPMQVIQLHNFAI